MKIDYQKLQNYVFADQQVKKSYLSAAPLDGGIPFASPLDDAVRRASISDASKPFRGGSTTTTSEPFNQLIGLC